MIVGSGETDLVPPHTNIESYFYVYDTTVGSERRKGVVTVILSWDIW